MEFPFSEATRAKRKSRKGAMPLNVETLMKKDLHDKGDTKLSSLQFRAFALALQEKLAFVGPPSQVSTDEAIEAAKQLQSKGGVRKHLEVGALSGAAAPLIAGASRATRGFVDTRGGIGKRLAGAAKGVGAATLGDVAAQSVGAGLTGGVLSAGRTGLQTHSARKKLQTFMKQRYGEQGV